MCVDLDLVDLHNAFLIQKPDNNPQTDYKHNRCR